MDPQTPTPLAQLRDLLLERRLQLASEIRTAALARQESPSLPLAQEVRDGKDEATLQQFSAIDDAQEQRDRDELAEVQAALRRLDDGSYGDCADCGEPIPLQRLRVQPAAARCAACQTAREQREAASGSSAVA